MLNRSTVSIAVGLALGALGNGASAAGFALMEQNASGIGNAFAGAAASAEDAGTIYFNPDGMPRVRGRQVVGVLSLVAPSAKFSSVLPSQSSSCPSQVSLFAHKKNVFVSALLPSSPSSTSPSTSTS